MKKGLIIGIVIVILIVIVVVLLFLLIDKNIDYYSCNDDTDCISVDAGCCGCSSSGSAISINQKYEEKYIQSLSTQCAAISCIQVISDNPSCFSKPVCNNKKCELFNVTD